MWRCSQLGLFCSRVCASRPRYLAKQHAAKLQAVDFDRGLPSGALLLFCERAMT